MNEMSLNEIKEEINIIRYYYIRATHEERRKIRQELYSSKKLTNFIKDAVWEYLNEDYGSPYFMTYSNFLERCEFYENNVKVHSTNDK